MTDKINLQALYAEFDRSLVTWRPQGSVSSKGTVMALGYIDARDVMDRLDTVCGPENWRDSYTETPRGRVICTLSIRIDGEWVSKSDGAGDSQVEAEKGAISDALKRAAVKWGVGRYLYDLDSPWVACETYTGKDNKPHFRRFTEDPWRKVRRAPRVFELPHEEAKSPSLDDQRAAFRASLDAEGIPHDPETGEVRNDGATIRETWEQGIRDALAPGYTEDDFWADAAAQLKIEFSEYGSQRGLNNGWAKYGKILTRMKAEAPDRFDALHKHYQQCEQRLADKPKAPVLTKAAGEAILDAMAKRDTLIELDVYMDALRAGPNSFAADHPKIKAAYEEHKAAIIEANPAVLGEIRVDNPHDANWTPG